MPDRGTLEDLTLAEVSRFIDLRRSGKRVIPNGLFEEEPVFSVGEVAKAFLGVTSYWLRWRDREGYLRRPNGTVVGRRRVKGNARAYTLRDIEEIARLLHANKLFSEEKMAHVLMMVAMRAQVGLEEDRVPEESEG